jgi:hypothetical protein
VALSAKFSNLFRWIEARKLSSSGLEAAPGAKQNPPFRPRSGQAGIKVEGAGLPDSICTVGADPLVFGQIS